MKKQICTATIVLLLGCSEPTPQREVEASPSNVQVTPPVVELNASAQIELMLGYLDSTCPVDEFQPLDTDGGAPMSLEAYNAYFNEKRYSQTFLLDIGARESKVIPMFDRLFSVERLSKIRLETIDGLTYRYEAVLGTIYRQLLDDERYLNLNYESPERASIWREDCQAFLKVRMKSKHIQLDSTAYEVRYFVDAKRSAQLTSIDRLDDRAEFRGGPKPINPKDSLGGWESGEKVVVMRTCYNPNPRDRIVEVLCTEHNLTSPGGPADHAVISRVGG